MDFKVGVGKSDFEELRQSGDYYVDKTELLYELVNDTDNKVTLFTRPRRFGKTLMMSMLENLPLNLSRACSNAVKSQHLLRSRWLGLPSVIILWSLFAFVMIAS